MVITESKPPLNPVCDCGKGKKPGEPFCKSCMILLNPRKHPSLCNALYHKYDEYIQAARRLIKEVSKSTYPPFSIVCRCGNSKEGLEPFCARCLSLIPMSVRNGLYENYVNNIGTARKLIDEKKKVVQ